MAHYCIKPKESKGCQFLYKGAQIGTEKPLCNILSNPKPCEVDDESLKTDTKKSNE